METIRRKRWGLDLFVVVAAAYATARTVNTFIASSIAGAAGVARRSPPKAPATAPRTELRPDAITRILGFDARGVGRAISSNATPVALPLRLEGTVIANLPEWSIASLREVDSGRVRTVGLGDEVLGARVIAIGRWKVSLLIGERIEILGPVDWLLPRPGFERKQDPLVSSEPDFASEPWRSIRATSSDSYEVPRSALDWVLAHLGDLAMRVRVMPSFRGGQTTGFSLSGFQPDSVFARLGIASGDVIRRINGYELSSPDRILEVYSNLMSQGRFEVELERGGATLRKTYSVSG